MATALTIANMGSEVKANIGRSSDTTLVTDDRVERWVNQAQRNIIRSNPGLRDTLVIDKTTWTTGHAKYEYDLADFTLPVAHIRKIKYVDPVNKTMHTLEPYPGGADDWDVAHPDLNEYGTTAYGIDAVSAGAGGTFTVSEDLSALIAIGTRFKVNGSTNNDADWEVRSFTGTTVLTVITTQTVGATANGNIYIGVGDGVPTHYIQRGNKVEIHPVPSLAYTAKELYLYYDHLPVDDTRLLSDFDDAIIFRAMGQGYYILGKHKMARECLALSDAFVQERVKGEEDFDEIEQIADYGP